MTRPRYSVVIPAFNHEAFIVEAVAGVLHSGINDLEVIVVDDGSTDNTAGVLEPLTHDPRLTLHRQPNAGAHATLNRLFNMAHGHFIFILDSDDAFEPERLTRLSAALEGDSETVLATSWITVIDESGAELGVKQAWSNMPPWAPPGSQPHLSDLGDPTLALLEANWVATTSNFAFRRELVTDHDLRFADLRYTHDWDFLLSAAAIGSIAVIEEPLLRYRVHQQNTIREGASDPAADALMQLEILWTLGRHSAPLLDQAVQRGFDRQDLEARMVRSQPRFGAEQLALQLRALRGSAAEAPAVYDELLKPDHPWRQAALEILIRTDG